MQSMQTAVDDFEQALEPLVHARNLAEWDAATTATDANEQQLVAASKRVDTVLAERERYAQLVEADHGGGADAQFARRVRLARLASEASQRDRALADRIIESEARLGSLFSRHRGKLGGRRSTTTRSARSCASRPTATSGAGPGMPRSRSGDTPHRSCVSSRTCATRRPAHSATAITSSSPDARRARRDLAAGTARRPRRASLGDLGAHQGVHRPGPPRAPGPRRGRAAATLGLRRRVLPGPADGRRRPARGGARARRSRGGRPRLFPRAGRRRRRSARAQRPLPARRQEPARVLRRHRSPSRRARARQLRARDALARHDGARARARRLRPHDRRPAAVAPALARAHVHDRGDRDAARAPRAR